VNKYPRIETKKALLSENFSERFLGQCGEISSLKPMSNLKTFFYEKKKASECPIEIDINKRLLKKSRKDKSRILFSSSESANN